MANLKISDVVFRKDLYPRFKPNPQVIQTYSENLDQLPPIEVNQNNILIDGYHRLKAYETAGTEEIPCMVIETESEEELFRLSVEKNAKHGLQLKSEEKKSLAIRWWDVFSKEEICQTLSVGERMFERWTKSKREAKEAEIKQKIYDMWLACYTQEEIAQTVGMEQKTISNKIADFSKNRQMSDITIFRNFEPQLYSIWNFAKQNNTSTVFGSLPPLLMDNLLYYFTKPLDVIMDPFGGGGMTIDKCVERSRRYYVTDLSPIPAREDIRQHDITTGLPPCPVIPDFVFLDPPYWKQAAGKYSDKKTDLGNVSLDAFLEFVGSIARDMKRKWNGKSGKLALIMGEVKEDGKFIDLPFLCYERIKKYLNPIRRIQVPYNTQIHGGAFVNMAKEKKEILYLSRDLMVFENG